MTDTPRKTLSAIASEAASAFASALVAGDLRKAALQVKGAAALLKTSLGSRQPSPERWLAPGVVAPPLPFVGETMRWDINDTTLEVTLQRAPCNEIGLQTLAELEQLAAFVHRGAGGARALIFHSAQPAGFCAGADLRALYEGLSSRRGEGHTTVERVLEVRRFIDRIHAVFNALDTAPITTIAACHGVVFGGGFELALTCDIIVADKSARFCFPELRLGLVPGFGGIPRLERDLGNGLVRDMMLTGRSINAPRAQAIGLVSQLVARDRALDVARSIARQSARFDAATTATAKHFTKPLPLARLEQEKDTFCRLLASPVVEAALKKFVESTDVLPYLP